MSVPPPVPKRILMSADTVGGVWTYTMELSRALGAYGIEIALATMGAPLSRDQRTQVAAIPNVELFESNYKLEWMNDPWDDVDNAGEWLLQLEDQVRPDLVHLNGFSHGSLPWRVPKIVVGHSCVLSWWRATKGCEAPPEWNEYRTRVLEGLALADLVVAPSHAMMSALEEYYGPFAASAVIPNGRSVTLNPVAAKSNFILGAGRLWDEAKNTAALVDVAAEIDWPVYLAGKTHDLNCSDANHPNVRELGQVTHEKLATWYNHAAIFAAPAKYEPFGLSILEAAQAGCALVLGDIPSLRENWDGAALFVAPDDRSALKSAIQNLIAAPGLHREFSTNAQKTARSFTAEKMASQYLAAYSALLTKFPSGIRAAEVLALIKKEPCAVTLWKGASCT